MNNDTEDLGSICKALSAAIESTEKRLAVKLSNADRQREREWRNEAFQNLFAISSVGAVRAAKV